MSMKYDPTFLTKAEADALFDLCQLLPHEREPNRLIGTGKNQRVYSYYRKISYPYFSLHPKQGDATRFRHLDSAPALIQQLRARLADYAKKDIQYIGVGGYEMSNDGMTCHQHAADRQIEDQTVYVVSLGQTRRIAIHEATHRCSNCSKAHGMDKLPALNGSPQILQPVHGSLYVLPHEYNTTHFHGVLRERKSVVPDLRIILDCKHDYPNLVRTARSEERV